jgi:SAM-dependent methyltransferase
MKAWGGRPELTTLLYCAQCGFRFYDRGLSAQEAQNYYDGYRSEEYYQTRRRYEIFYSRKAHEGTANWLGSADRKRALASVLRQAGAPGHFSATLDFGGGTGHMLLGIEADKKAVFDLSNDPPEPGIQAFRRQQDLSPGWDLILSCHVLEHLSNPFDQVKQIADLMSPGGWLYAEVPNQIWRDKESPKALHKAWLSWLVQHPIALHMADCVSTAFRVRYGVLPTLGFVPMREHINFFTETALRELLGRAGLNIGWSGITYGNNFCAVATRNRLRPVS